MSEESYPQYEHTRQLKDDERNLLTEMLRHARKENTDDLSTIFVRDMSDGGMGSIAFAHGKSEKIELGAIIAEANYTDDDGVLVSIVLNADKKGDLYELDFWKVDFSPLRQYPKPEQLRFKNVLTGP